MLQREAVRIRMTQALIDFIKPVLPDLIRSTLGGAGSGFTVDANNVLHIPIPDTDLFDIGVAEARMRDAEALLWLDDLDQRLELSFEEPNGVRFALNNLRFGVKADLKEDFAGSTSSCPIVGTLGTPPERHAAEVSVNALLDPGVGPDPDRNFDVRTSVDDIALNDLDVDIAGNYCNTEPECQDCAIEVAGTCLDIGGRCVECEIFCGGITNAVLDLVTALIDVVRPLLNRLLKPIIQNFMRSFVADLNNTPAKVEMQINLGDILGIAAFDQANPFGIFVAPEPGRFPVLDRGTGLGMEITTSGGAEAELADCIGDLADFNMPKGPVPVLGGTDARGRPYHVGMTLASSLINQILYALHRSGSLCLEISSEDIKTLTGGAFSLNASVLSLLASDLSELADDAAPIILQLKPRNAPLLDLGSGEVTGQDAMGNDIYDWLLKANIEDMGLAFHVLIKDRFVRVFEVTMDVNIGLNIVVLPDNRLEVSVGEMRIDDFKEEFNEILPNADFAMVLPTLIDLVLQTLISNQLTFDVDISSALSDALGGAPLFLRVNEIRRDGIQEDFLTMTMTFTSSAGANLSLAAETYARLADDDGVHQMIEEGRHKPTGRLRMVVGEPLAYTDQRALEYQVRVDKGLWRGPLPARPDGTLYVEDFHLLMPGTRDVEVRARYADDYQTLDATPASFNVLVDPTPPSVSASLRGDAVVLKARDAYSPAHTLVMMARLDEGEWFAVEADADDELMVATAELPWSMVSEHMFLELQAVDAVGNTSDIARMRVGALTEAAPEGELDAGCGCHAAAEPHGHSEGLLAFLLLAGLLVFRRKGRT